MDEEVGQPEETHFGVRKEEHCCYLSFPEVNA